MDKRFIEITERKHTQRQCKSHEYIHKRTGGFIAA